MRNEDVYLILFSIAAVIILLSLCLPIVLDKMEVRQLWLTELLKEWHCAQAARVAFEKNYPFLCRSYNTTYQEICEEETAAELWYKSEKRWIKRKRPLGLVSPGLQKKARDEIESPWNGMP